MKTNSQPNSFIPLNQLIPENRAMGKQPKKQSRLLHLAILLVIFLVASCASVPKDYVRRGSMAFQNHESTIIGKQLADMAAEQYLPGNRKVAIQLVTLKGAGIERILHPVDG